MIRIRVPEEEERGNGIRHTHEVVNFFKALRGKETIWKRPLKTGELIQVSKK